MPTWGEAIDRALDIARRYGIGLTIELEGKTTPLFFDGLYTVPYRHQPQTTFNVAGSGMTITRKTAHPDEAWDWLEELDYILERLYGGNKKTARDRLPSDAPDAKDGEAS